MFRLPLLDSLEFPKGRLQPYLGVGPGFFVTSVKVDVPGLGEQSTDWQFEVGADVRAGVAFMITLAFGTFIEGRYTVFSTNPGGQSTEFDIETVHVTGGVPFAGRLPGMRAPRRADRRRGCSRLGSPLDRVCRSRSLTRRASSRIASGQISRAMRGLRAGERVTWRSASCTAGGREGAVVEVTAPPRPNSAYFSSRRWTEPFSKK